MEYYDTAACGRENLTKSPMVPGSNTSNSFSELLGTCFCSAMINLTLI